VSASAQVVLEQFRLLPLTEQQQVCQRLAEWAAKANAPAPPADPIRSARGMFAGSHLTAALLASRAEERRREALSRLRGASKGKGLLAKLLADRAKEGARG